MNNISFLSISCIISTSCRYACLPTYLEHLGNIWSVWQGNTMTWKGKNIDVSHVIILSYFVLLTCNHSCISWFVIPFQVCTEVLSFLFTRYCTANRLRSNPCIITTFQCSLTDIVFSVIFLSTNCISIQKICYGDSKYICDIANKFWFIPYKNNPIFQG